MSDETQVETVDPMDTAVVSTMPIPGTEIGRFSGFQLQNTIDEAVKQIPDGCHVAVIGHANRDGFRAGVAYVEGHWSVMGVFETGWNGKWNGEVAVRWAK